MPSKLDRCIKSIEKKIQKGELSKTYIDKGKKRKTSAWAICKSAMKK